MTTLRFPVDLAVGELWWEDAREPEGSGHLLAVGDVEVPDGTPVTLDVGAIAEVGVYDRDGRPRVTWLHGPPGRASANVRSIWGEPGETSYYVKASERAVDLEFIRSLPADSVADLHLAGAIVRSSFPSVAHLAPGLRKLTVILDWLCDDALAVVAELPALASLQLYSGSFTEHGLQQLGRLQNLRDLHIERPGLPASAFRFAASMPKLTRLAGPDEIPDQPMASAEVDQLRAMLARVCVC